MAQVGAALAAHGFNPHHAVAAVHTLFDGVGHRRLREAGPAAARIKFAVRLEKLGIAADAAVNAWRPVGFVLACEWTFGGGLTRDGIGRRFGALGIQQLAPLLFGFDNATHDEQLISSWLAQSGGSSA